MKAFQSIIDRLRGPTPEPLEGEPTIAPLGARGSSAPARGLVLVFLAGLGLIAVGAWAFNGGGPDEDETSRERIAPARGAPPQTFERPEPEPEPEPAEAVVEEPEPTVEPEPEPASRPTYVAPPPPPAPIHKGALSMTVADASAEMPENGVVMSDASGAGGGFVEGGGWQEPAPNATVADSGSLASNLTPTPLDGVSASVLPDIALTLPRGNKLDCVSNELVVSELAGLVSCTLTHYAYSPRQVPLMEPGTKITGEYKRVSQGSRYIFFVWERARTSRGVIVNLNSPGTGPRGRRA